ncbi:MAG: bile acid:sodium symporter family protein [Nitritalea sp.]
MEGSILTAVFLPLALAFIMLGMGLSLKVNDFKLLFLQPKAVLLGLFNQLVLLPLVGFGLVLAFRLTGPLAVGVMVIAACPGGPTSNLIAHLSRGDLALSISLTALSSILTIMTIPFIVNFSIGYFGEEGSVFLPIGQSILQIMGVTLIPVSIGMFLHKRFPKLVDRADRPVRIASAVLFTLILVAAILKEKESLVPFFLLTGPIALLLNASTLVLGFLLASAFLLPKAQRKTIAIESGIQNGTLGIMITATLLGNAEMTIPVAIYSLLMFLTAIPIILLANAGQKSAA